MSDPHFNGLSPADAESLALLAEEAAEVIQMIGKTLRHGLESCHPDGGESNRVMLAQEVGDLLASIQIAVAREMLSHDEVEQARSRKLDRVAKYLHHAKVPMRILLPAFGVDPIGKGGTK